MRCERSLFRRTAYRIGDGWRCLHCTLRYRPLLKRSALTALVVGTLLTGINQGSEMLVGVFPTALVWKVPLTYMVPFCVATWGALSHSRS